MGGGGGGGHFAAQGDKHCDTRNFLTSQLQTTDLNTDILSAAGVWRDSWRIFGLRKQSEFSLTNSLSWHLDFYLILFCLIINESTSNFKAMTVSVGLFIDLSFSSFFFFFNSI